MAGTGAMIALVYGITRAGEHGWTDALTLAAFAIAAVLLGVFLALQAHTALPLLPLSLFADRNRVGSYATILFIGAGLKGSFHPLALFLQQVLQHEPLKTGVASLPFAARNILAAGGMSWLSTLTQGSSYAGHVMPALFGTSFGLGLGLGLAFVPLTLTAVHRIADDRAGVASALVNMAQQIGAALGLAVSTTAATTAADDELPPVSGHATASTVDSGRPYRA